MAALRTLRLILGDQLNYQHSWFKKTDDAVLYVLMEVRQETDYVVHHIQKILAFFAAMRAFADALQKKGHRVIYLHLDDPENRQDFAANLRQLISKHGIKRFEYLWPDEYRLDEQFQTIAEALAIEARGCNSQHFLTGREDVKQMFAGKKRYLMESFYRDMRRRHNILLENGKPAGGKWNYDTSNRKRYNGKVPIPKPKRFKNDVGAILKMLDAEGVRHFGRTTGRTLLWPVTPPQARSLLKYFLEHGLPHFGTYQDAMTTADWSLFHSRISFALNVKMLDPLAVIEAAVKRWQDNPDGITIAQVEGFVRQILGWREYMRGIYWALMPAFASLNFFDHKAKLPDYFWTGATRMHCLAKAIGQSLDYAYAHHIQRLMITGNFALLVGVHPDAVEAWYLGVYVDAVQWVEMPNTRGMSQFAEGGLIATKPYISSANYINKMSDYCKGCFYDHKKRHGDKACPFNGLYWHFLDRHRRRLDQNPRMGTMYRVLDRMEQGEKKKILAQGEYYLKAVDTL
jgi:deoxyribodipyrimidine photolyase-related protein